MDRYEKIPRYRGNRFDLVVAGRARGAQFPRLVRSATGVGPVRHVRVDAAGALFYRVYLSRNLVIVASGAIFLLLRQWTPPAVLVTIAAVLPLFDMSFLWLNGLTPSAVHPIALLLLATSAALLWRRARAVRI
jgi:hypothetical protein